MKTLNIIPVLIGVLLLIVHSLFANDKRYMEAMQKNINAVYEAESISALQSSVNSLARIADAEKTKWEPYYYAAFGYIMMADREKDPGKKDLYLDQATGAIGKAKSINDHESEIVALEGFVHMIRVTVDPATRGPQYVALAMQQFGKATAMNPDNPRALALMAQMQHGTAKFFSSPLTEACTTLDRALQKFETYTSENPLSPRWGGGMALELKKECN
jgi:hypothetical protein